MLMVPILRRLRYTVRCLLSGSPTIYLSLAGLKRKDAEGPKTVHRGTDIVIEAFPRSGNTFAYFAFCANQPGPVEVAHHFHAPAQLIAAAHWGIPALLIVRHPADAVCSFVQREPAIPLHQALRSWILFHRRLLFHMDHFVVATFDQVTHDFGQVIGRINGRFGTGFTPFSHDEQAVADCFRRIELRNAERFGGGRIVATGIARPMAERTVAKARLTDKLNRERRLVAAMKEARELHEHYVQRAQSAPVPAGTPV